MQAITLTGAAPVHRHRAACAGRPVDRQLTAPRGTWLVACTICSHNGRLLLGPSRARTCEERRA